MNHSIQIKQNTPPFLDLIKASSFIYSKAAELGSARVVIAVLTISTLPFIVKKIESLELAISIAVSILIIISDHLLGKLEDDYKASGAKIQEEFDTQLYDMEWNEAAAADHILPEVRQTYGQKYVEKNPITDWYPDTTGIRSPLDILICQRANFVWDIRQREAFAFVILVGSFAFVTLLIISGCVVRQNFGAYLVAMILPSYPLVSQAIAAYKAHMKNVADKKELYRLLLEYWKREISHPGSVSMADCRRIQDRLYLLRKEGPIIPRWWYDRTRPEYEGVMHKTAEELKAEALAVTTNP